MAFADRFKTPLGQAVGPVAVGVVFIALLGAGLWGCAAWVSSNSGEGSRLEVNLGEDEFNLGRAERRAEEVAERGPLLFPGLLGPDRGYIVVTHIGTDPLKGWHAFDALPAGQAIECAVQWDPDRRELVDPCTGDLYPLDGGPLTTYPVYITPAKEVLVDLTPEGRPGAGPSTTPPPG